MKTFWHRLNTPTFRLIIGVAVALGYFIITLASEPTQFIQTSAVGWLVVRLKFFAVAIVLGFLSFTSGEIRKGLKEIALEKEYLDNKDNSDLRTQGYNPFDIFLIEAPLIGWLIWWAICFQVFATFYVADWCRTGF